MQEKESKNEINTWLSLYKCTTCKTKRRRLEFRCLSNISPFLLFVTITTNLYKPYIFRKVWQSPTWNNRRKWLSHTSKKVLFILAIFLKKILKMSISKQRLNRSIWYLTYMFINIFLTKVSLSFLISFLVFEISPYI